MKVEDDIIRKYLEDIRTSIDAIDIHLGKRPSFKKYLKNLTMRRAVEREFEIIGEATVRILKIDPNFNISHSKRIINLRNRVIHAYDSVDDNIIWGIIVQDVPILKQEILSLLDHNSQS